MINPFYLALFYSTNGYLPLPPPPSLKEVVSLYELLQSDLENSTSANVRLNLMVFWPDDGDRRQSIAGVDLHFDDHPLQADHGAGIDAGKHAPHFTSFTP